MRVLFRPPVASMCGIKGWKTAFSIRSVWSREWRSRPLSGSQTCMRGTLLPGEQESAVGAEQGGPVCRPQVCVPWSCADARVKVMFDGACRRINEHDTVIGAHDGQALAGRSISQSARFGGHGYRAEGSPASSPVPKLNIAGFTVAPEASLSALVGGNGGEGRDGHLGSVGAKPGVDDDATGLDLEPHRDPTRGIESSRRP